MLLTVAAALLGARFGLDAKNPLAAALVAAAFGGAAHFALDFLLAGLLLISADPASLGRVFHAIGAGEDRLVATMAAAALSALGAGVLAKLSVEKPLRGPLPGEDGYRKTARKRRRPGRRPIAA